MPRKPRTPPPQNILETEVDPGPPRLPTRRAPLARREGEGSSATALLTKPSNTQKPKLADATVSTTSYSTAVRAGGTQVSHPQSSKEDRRSSPRRGEHVKITPSSRDRARDASPEDETMYSSDAETRRPSLRPRRSSHERAARERYARSPRAERDHSPLRDYDPHGRPMRGRSEPWRFNGTTGLIGHPKCPTCVEYARHFFEAANDFDESLRDAQALQRRHHNRELEGELFAVKQKLHQEQAERDNLEDEVYFLREEIDRLEDRGKRKRPRHADDPAPLASKDALRYDDEPRQAHHH